MADKPTFDQNPVPKFTSFRPKITQTSSTPSDKERSQVQSTDAEPRHVKRHRPSHHEHSSRRCRSRHEWIDGGSSSQYQHRPRDQHGKQVTPPLSRDDTAELFATDKFGDESNAKYGSLHRYDVPTYLRTGFGSIVGLAREQKIDREASNEKHVVVTDLRGAHSNKRDRLTFTKLKSGRETRIKSFESAIELKDKASADFLSLSGHKHSGQREDDDAQCTGSSASSGDEQHHYRSIQGKAKPTIKPEDSDLEYTVSLSKSEVDQVSQGPDIKLLRKAALSRKVDLEPENGQAWLDLIDYQGTMMMSHALEPGLNLAERMSVADIKISIYEKALNSVKDLQHRESLLLGLMEEGSKVWETRKLASRWKRILHDNPHHVGLWTRYLDFEQTTFSTFRLDEVRETYTKCLEILRGVPRQDENILDIQVYVLLRFTICLREAGFPEQATAMWQGILEFNCLRPASSEEGSTAEAAQKQLLERFEVFWESEVPRIGEKNAQGWARSKFNGEELPSPKADKPLSCCGLESPSNPWHDDELMRFLEARQPARTIDDTVEDDPYRVVLFSDISPFLLPLSTMAQRKLVTAFLAFCQLPPTEDIPTQCMAWWRDPFVRNGGPSGLEAFFDPVKMSTSDSDPRQGSVGPLQTPLTSAFGYLESPISFYIPSTDVLFAMTGLGFSIFDDWVLACGKNQGPVDVDWVRRVVSVLVDVDLENDSLGEYLIALDCKVAPSSARKTAKALLKARPTSLRLYNAYALVESRLGNTTAAESVWSTAINMSKTLDLKIRQETILLWRTWVWELLDTGNPRRAFERLLTFADEVLQSASECPEASPATVLRTQRALIDGRDHALSFGDDRRTLLYVECLVLLEYLANSASIDAALSCLGLQVKLLSIRSPHGSQAHELLHQTRAKLLHYHITHTHSFKPAVIRSTLEESIKLFPQNTMFLSLYAWNENRFRVDDRVRSIVREVVFSTDTRNHSAESVVSLFFSVYTELTRGAATGSNIHSIRASFERAVESQRGKQSAMMWKLYFLFEHSRGELHKAKMIFYRAVRACPWVKELYLLPFQYLRRVTPVEELRGVYEMLVEKELRVFTSLDEIFEDRNALSEQ